jgi:hypothetical protein
MLKAADAYTLYNKQNTENIKGTGFLHMRHLMVSKTLISYTEQEKNMCGEFQKVDWV